MNLTIKNVLLLTMMAALGLSSCKTVDIRTEYALNHTAASEYTKGKQLLTTAYEKMGYDQLENVATYQTNALFKWKMPWTMMPMNALPGNKGKELEFRFATNTFDGKVKFLEGRKKGKTYGIQSWQTYRINRDNRLDQIKGTKYNWGLATYHYVIEAPMRLLNAEIIRYAGEKSFDGKIYDLVYATWGKDEPHSEHDQWLVYINRQTGFIDLTELTINDFFLPMPKGLKGATVQYEREQTEIGAYLPSFVTIQLGKPKKKKKYVYNFKLYNYQFDGFEESELYPIPGLEKVGDAKTLKE